MTSATEIANLALQRLGEPAIADLETSTGKAARECRTAYNPARRAVLRDHVWSFAKERAVLPAMSEPPAWGFSAQYQLPTDWIRMGWTEHDDPWVGIPWKVEGRKLLINSGGPLNILYIRNVDETGEFDDIFVQALAAYMAYLMAEPITQSNTKKVDAFDGYQYELGRAKTADSFDQSPDEMPEDEWITVRA